MKTTYTMTLLGLTASLALVAGCMAEAEPEASPEPVEAAAEPVVTTCAVLYADADYTGTALPVPPGEANVPR